MEDLLLCHDFCLSWFWIESLITFSFFAPTLSAKNPSPQKESPQRNSSKSGYSFLMTKLDPPLSICITWERLSLGFICKSIWTWSICTLSSWISQSFISHASTNSSFSLLAISPLSTLRRYLGQKTKWKSNRCLVEEPVLYSVTQKSWHFYLRKASFACSAPGMHSPPALKGWRSLHWVLELICL